MRRIRIINKIQDLLHGADTVKFMKWLRLRWYGHTEKSNNERNN